MNVHPRVAPVFVKISRHFSSRHSCADDIHLAGGHPLTSSWIRACRPFRFEERVLRSQLSSASIPSPLTCAGIKHLPQRDPKRIPRSFFSPKLPETSVGCVQRGVAIRPKPEASVRHIETIKEAIHSFVFGSDTACYATTGTPITA